MATIPNKQKALLNFEIAAGANETIQIPNSEKYTCFAFTLDSLTNQTFTLTGRVSGSTKLNGTPVDPETIVMLGGSTTNDEVDIVLSQKSRTYTFRLHAPMELHMNCANGGGGAVSFTLAVMMSGSIYSAAL